MAAFLQPDEFGFLTHSGTLWSWPGQNPIRYGDPTGRYAGALPGAAAAAGGGAAAAAGAGLAAAGIVGYAVWDIYHQIDDWQHPIVSHADPDKPAAGGKEPCPDASSSSSGAQADSSGGGAEGPPAAKGDVGADSPDPIDPNKLNHIFGKPEHGLDDFVQASGGREQAFGRIQDAANAALQNGELNVGPNGILPSGNAGNIIDVGGVQIRLIGGRVINGIVQIASASRMGLP